MARDIHYQLVNPSDQSIGKYFTFGSNVAIGIDGPQKLANRWIKLLLESPGSSAVSPGRGTEFNELIGSNVDALDDLQALVRQYIDEVNDQLRRLDSRSQVLTNDERLRDGNIIQFNIVPPDGIEVWVELRSVSGRRVEVLLPISSPGDIDG